MNFKLYVPVYSATLLLSAALLFSVQPMFSKMILPLLGGTPQVWNTAMLFFQIMLLGGYAYAHGTTKFLSVRHQSILHIVLLCLFVLVLPIAIPEGWVPPINEDPTIWQLSLMTMTVGGPFFVLSGSAPMLQRWFSQTGHPDAANPYFLYGASNLGSMTALLSYPVIIEPLLTLNQQSLGWEGGYIGLIILTVLSALLVWKSTPAQTKIVHKAANDEHISWKTRGLWLILAFIPSSLMLGVTTFITTDVASVPLLWIMPLALYVSTFIIVFSRKPIISQEKATMIFGFLIIMMLAHMMIFSDRALILMPFHMVLFFFAALSCHSALAASKPRAENLTEFYLIMSLGGALGGAFNALIAPNFFVIPIEYALVLGAACFMRYAAGGQKFQTTKINPIYIGAACCAVLFAAINFNIEARIMLKSTLALGVIGSLALVIDRRALFAFPVALILLLYPPGHIWGQFLFEKVVHQDRNFFGVLKVIDESRLGNQRALLHGTTNHGTQALDPEYRLMPLSYYSPSSPIRDGFSAIGDNTGQEQRVAVLGLGIGVTACFNAPGRHFNFYEIDPQVAEIAENPEYFTFLSDCGSPYRIIMGDARLTIADQPDGYYDLILVDAFSSDNIPVHTITKEAVELYFDKLKPDGLLIFNVSNNYLDIEPVLTSIAHSLNIPVYARMSDDGTIPDTNLRYYVAHFVALSKNPEHIRFLEQAGWTPARERSGVGIWTDQFSNIVSVIGNRTGLGRMRELAKTKRDAQEAREAP